MKRIIFILFSIFLSNIHSFSQVSQGGTPVSFYYKTDSEDIDTHLINPPDVEKINAEDTNHDKDGSLFKIGRLIPVNLSIDNCGTWKVLEDGTRIWQLKLISHGAKALSIYYNKFKLPAGSRLFIYNEEKTQLIGAFTEANNPESGKYATELIGGENVIIEYEAPTLNNQKPELEISDLGFVYRGVRFPSKNQYKDFGDSESCQINIHCSPEGDNWQNQQRGVARILIVVSVYLGWCSGSLVNNVKQDCTPYFLTADHCAEGATTSNLNQWIFYFNYESSNCNNPVSENYVTTSHTITGGTKKANGGSGGDTGSDFFLLQLNENVPANYNAYFNGWNRSTTASPSGVSIHHPYGDIKKISTYTSNLVNSGWGINNTHWQTTWATTTHGHGVTEGGSSGSPLFDNLGFLVGTLTGGGSACVTNGAGTGTGPLVPDFYGKFSYHWSSNGTTTATQLKPWLDPNNQNLMNLSGKNNICSSLPPTANFIADNETIFVNEKVNFFDQSINDPWNWKWYFDGAVIDSSMEQNPLQITFNTVGSFDVTLIVTNAYGTDTIVKPAYITVLQTPPDLTIQSPSLIPSTVDAGSTIDASFSVKNVGGTEADSSTVKFYYSTNSVYNAGTDEYLDSLEIGNLAIGAAQTYNITLTIPASATAGSKYIIFIADANNVVVESNENNNSIYKIFTVNQYLPDLFFPTCSIDSLVIRKGSTTNTSCDIKNQGNSDSQNCILKYYISSNNSYETSDLYLTETTINTISSGQQLHIENNITIPTSMSNGNWYILLIADANGSITESSESNNIGYKQISVIAGVGINELENNYFTVTPNPSNGEFQCKVNKSNSKCNIIIYNVLGEIIYNESFISTINENRNISLRNQSEGVYILQFSDGNFQKNIRLIIEK